MGSRNQQGTSEGPGRDETYRPMRYIATSGATGLPEGKGAYGRHPCRSTSEPSKHHQRHRQTYGMRVYVAACTVHLSGSLSLVVVVTFASSFPGSPHRFTRPILQSSKASVHAAHRVILFELLEGIYGHSLAIWKALIQRFAEAQEFTTSSLRNSLLFA